MGSERVVYVVETKDETGKWTPMWCALNEANAAMMVGDDGRMVEYVPRKRPRPRRRKNG